MKKIAAVCIVLVFVIAIVFSAGCCNGSSGNTVSSTVDSTLNPAESIVEEHDALKFITKDGVISFPSDGYEYEVYKLTVTNIGKNSVLIRPVGCMVFGNGVCGKYILSFTGLTF